MPLRELLFQGWKKLRKLGKFRALITSQTWTIFIDHRKIRARRSGENQYAAALMLIMACNDRCHFFRVICHEITTLLHGRKVMVGHLVALVINLPWYHQQWWSNKLLQSLQTSANAIEKRQNNDAMTLNPNLCGLNLASRTETWVGYRRILFGTCGPMLSLFLWAFVPGAIVVGLDILVVWCWTLVPRLLPMRSIVLAVSITSAIGRRATRRLSLIPFRTFVAPRAIFALTFGIISRRKLDFGRWGLFGHVLRELVQVSHHGSCRFCKGATIPHCHHQRPGSWSPVCQKLLRLSWSRPDTLHHPSSISRSSPHCTRVMAHFTALMPSMMANMDFGDHSGSSAWTICRSSSKLREVDFLTAFANGFTSPAAVKLLLCTISPSPIGVYTLSWCCARSTCELGHTLPPAAPPLGSNDLGHEVAPCYRLSPESARHRQAKCEAPSPLKCSPLMWWVKPPVKEPALKQQVMSAMTAWPTSTYVSKLPLRWDAHREVDEWCRLLAASTHAAMAQWVSWKVHPLKQLSAPKLPLPGCHEPPDSAWDLCQPPLHRPSLLWSYGPSWPSN